MTASVYRELIAQTPRIAAMHKSSVPSLLEDARLIYTKSGVRKIISKEKPIQNSPGLAKVKTLPLRKITASISQLPPSLQSPKDYEHN